MPEEKNMYMGAFQLRHSEEEIYIGAKSPEALEKSIKRLVGTELDHKRCKYVTVTEDTSWAQN